MKDPLKGHHEQTTSDNMSGNNQSAQGKYGAKYETCKALLESGANPNALNAKGITPTLLCLDWETPVGLELFINHGANLSIKYSGKTILEIAKERGLTKHVAVLVQHGAK